MRTKLASWLRAFRGGDEGAIIGQSMVESALIIVLTTVVCIAAVTLLGLNAKEYLWDVVDSVINVALAG